MKNKFILSIALLSSCLHASDSGSSSTSTQATTSLKGALEKAVQTSESVVLNDLEVAASTSSSSSSSSSATSSTSVSSLSQVAGAAAAAGNQSLATTAVGAAVIGAESIGVPAVILNNPVATAAESAAANDIASGLSDGEQALGKAFNNVVEPKLAALTATFGSTVEAKAREIANATDAKLAAAMAQMKKDLAAEQAQGGCCGFVRISKPASNMLPAAAATTTTK